jgi:hypothetical protein
MLSSTGPSIFPRLRWLPCHAPSGSLSQRCFTRAGDEPNFPPVDYLDLHPMAIDGTKILLEKTLNPDGMSVFCRGRPSETDLTFRLYILKNSKRIHNMYIRFRYRQCTSMIYDFHCMFYTFWCYIIYIYIQKLEWTLLLIEFGSIPGVIQLMVEKHREKAPNGAGVRCQNRSSGNCAEKVGSSWMCPKVDD